VKRSFSLQRKYRALSAPVKASYWFLVCGVIQRGLGFLTTPIFTRLMSTTEFGAYNVYLSWHNIFSIFITLNLAAGVYLRGLVKYEEDKRSFSQSMYTLTAALAVVWGLVIFVLQDPIAQLTDLSLGYLELILIDVFVCSFFQFWSAEQRVDFRYRGLVALTLIHALLQTAAGILVVRSFENKVLARVIVSVGSDVLFFAWLGVRPFLRKPVCIRPFYWKYGLRFNVPLIPHYLSQVVLNQSDRIMIKKLVDASAAGLYSLAYSLASVANIVNTAIVNTLTPWLYRKIKEKDFAAINKQSIGILCLVAAVNLALVLIAPEVIMVLAPRSYYEAIYVIPPVTASVFFIFLYSWFSVFEFYYEKTHLMTIASVCGAAANIALNYVFIRLYGYIAAGYTTLFCYMLYVVGHYYFMRRICVQKLDGLRVYNMKAIILICLGFLLLCGVIMALYGSIVIRYIMVAALAAAGIVFRRQILAVYTRIKGHEEIDQ